MRSPRFLPLALLALLGPIHDARARAPGPGNASQATPAPVQSRPAPLPAAPSLGIPAAMPAIAPDDRPDLEPGGGPPTFGVVERLDPAGNITIREVAGYYGAPDPGEPNGEKPQVPRTLALPAVSRSVTTLGELRAYDRSGRRITDEAQVRRQFASPCMVALVPAFGPKGVDPAYLAAFRPGIVLVAR